MAKGIFLAAVAMAASVQPALAADRCDTRTIGEAFTKTLYLEGKIEEAFTTYVSPNYVQHNPNLPNGREPAIAMLTKFRDSSPGQTTEIKRFLADGDLFAVHLRVRLKPEDPGMAFADFYRVADCKIVEHWDVMQPIPAGKTVNPAPMF